jgi:hypothetical protein
MIGLAAERARAADVRGIERLVADIHGVIRRWRWRADADDCYG